MLLTALFPGKAKLWFIVFPNTTMRATNFCFRNLIVDYTNIVIGVICFRCGVSIAEVELVQKLVRDRWSIGMPSPEKTQLLPVPTKQTSNLNLFQICLRFLIRVKFASIF